MESRFLSRILLLIQVSRPLLWPVLPLVYLFGIHSAQASVSGAVLFQALLLTLPMNLLGCALNDLYDIDSDRLSPRRRALWGATIHDSDRKFLLIVAAWMGPLLVIGAWLTHKPDNIVATVALVLVAWAYSVPPLRLKERPPLDSLSNGAGYFLLPFIMGYCLGADPRAMPIKYYLLGLAVAGIHALATAADYEADRAAGHRTFAVAFGRSAAAACATATFLAAWLLGDYHGTAVRVFLVVGAVAAALGGLIPSGRAIMPACVIIFVAFLLAALAHLGGW